MVHGPVPVCDEHQPWYSCKLKGPARGQDARNARAWSRLFSQLEQSISVIGLLLIVHLPVRKLRIIRIPIRRFCCFHGCSSAQKPFKFFAIHRSALQGTLDTTSAIRQEQLSLAGVRNTYKLCYAPRFSGTRSLAGQPFINR